MVELMVALLVDAEARTVGWVAVEKAAVATAQVDLG